MAEFNRLAPFTARHILMVAGALECDYRELSPDQAKRLLIYADQYRYPKPSNAAGSRGRYWHAYLLPSRQGGNAPLALPAPLLQ